MSPSDPDIAQLVREERLSEAAKLASERGDADLASRLYERACDWRRAAAEALLAGEAARALELALAAGDDGLAERAALLVSVDAARAGDAAAKLLLRGNDAWAARVLEGSGRTVDAARAWERAGFATRAAALLEQAGHPAQAARVLEAALRREPGLADATLMLGALLARFQKWDAAVRTLQRLPEGSPHRKQALGHLVTAFEALGLSHAASHAAAELASLGGAPQTGERAHEPAPVSKETSPRLFGRYDVVGEVASSPSARVLECIDLVHRERVAVKLFAAWDARGTGRDALARFEREVRAMRALEHPCVVPLRDFSTQPPALVLAWMAGGTLEQLMARGEPVAPARAAEIADSILSALGDAHRFGIIHRDVKPANVLFDDAGAARLGDFGVAHLSDISATATGGVFGTLAYMSPEQRAGRPASARSDLFAVGVMLREMLTGEPPVDGETRLVRPSEAHSGLDASHDAVVDRLTASDPTMRPSDADEARAMLFLREGRALSWPATAIRGDPARRGGQLPSSKPATGRVVQRDDGALVDTWSERRFERVPLSEWALETARGFAAANDAGLQGVLRVDRDGGAIWLEALVGVALDRPLFDDERAALRRALDALHRAGIVHGHVDRAHVVLCHGRPVLRFVAARTATATVDRDRLALATL